MLIETENFEFITTIRISASEKSNRFLPETQKKLAEILQEIHSSESARVVVLILDFGEAEKFGKTDIDENQSQFTTLCNLIKNFPVPIIAAVKSIETVTDFEIIKAAHLCVASDAAHFIFREDEETFSAKKISADEALDSGLINTITKASEVEQEAFKIAEKIARLAPLAIRACLKAVTKGSELTLENGLKLEIELFSQLFDSKDMREGVSAFLEKRQPVFEGK